MQRQFLYSLFSKKKKSIDTGRFYKQHFYWTLQRSRGVVVRFRSFRNGFNYNEKLQITFTLIFECELLNENLHILIFREFISKCFYKTIYTHV